MQTNEIYIKATESWDTIQTFVNARTVRERVLLLITGGAFVASILYSLLISPTSEQLVSLEEEKTNLTQQYDATHAQLVALKGGATSATKSLVQIQLEELLEKKNESLLKFKSKIIPPTRIPYLLESMLRDLSDLKLISLETLERAPFNSMKEANDNSALYKHRVRITFTGEYYNMLRYLKKVEKLPFPIGWESLEYKISRFPQAQIILTIYMLSTPLETSPLDTKQVAVGQQND